MDRWKAAGILVLCGFLGLWAFHLAHYLLFCRYKAVSGKSHCAVCGHRRVCRKFHSGHSGRA